jgi:GntR family transcriptional repressor for pyruvate dehydrogenase complex
VALWAVTRHDEVVSEKPAQAARPETAARGRRPGQWRPIARAKTYELVLDRIEEQILTGELRVGDRLPPERDLASLLGVSRSAVREAIRALQAQGVLHSTVGNGPDSGTIVSGSSGEALTRLLRLHVGLANFPIRDIVEARVMLERWSVKLAAANASAADLERLRELLTAMDDPQVPRAAFNDLDTAFHVTVAEAGGSRLVADLTSAVRGSMRYSLLAAFEESPDWAGVVEGLRGEHRAIYDRIAAGDAVGAADAVEAHVRGFFGRLAALVPSR